MKKELAKKSGSHAKRGHHKGRTERGMPLEFDRSWQDLEAQHNRLKSDWASLAAQLGIGGFPEQEF